MTTPGSTARATGDLSMPVVASDQPCIRCAYNLVGLPVEGKCPECGLAIERSCGVESPADFPSDCLRSIASGILWMQASAAAGALILGLMVIGVFFGLLLLVKDFLKDPFGGGSSVWPHMGLLVVGLVAMVVLAITSCCGAMMFTAAGSSGAETNESTRDRVAVRMIAVIQCGLNLVVIGTPLLWESALESLGGFFVFLMALSLLLQLVQVVAATSRAGWLFSRIQSSRGVARARTYVVLLPVLMIFGSIVLIGPLVAMFMHFRLLSRLRYELESVLDRRDEPTADRATRPASPSRVDVRPPMEQDRTP